jgi:hypothetical protein
MQRIVPEPVKRFHDRARAGKLSSVRSNQKQVNLAFGEVSSQKRCAMQRIVPEPVKGFMIGREQAN